MTEAVFEQIPLRNVNMIEDYSLTPQAVPVFRLSSMTEAARIDLRQQIDDTLTLKLEDLNLAEELALQFKQAKSLYADVVDDQTIAANQKAQVLNSCTSIIATITKAQAELYNAERLKKLEAATLKALKSLPKESQEGFFELYAGYLSA